jgi:hypothetical protein
VVCILNQLFYSADHMVMRCVRGSGLARRHQEQGVLPPIAVLHAQDFGERHVPQACVLGLCLQGLGTKPKWCTPLASLSP